MSDTVLAKKDQEWAEEEDLYGSHPLRRMQAAALKMREDGHAVWGGRRIGGFRSRKGQPFLERLKGPWGLGTVFKHKCLVVGNGVREVPFHVPEKKRGGRVGGGEKTARGNSATAGKG